VRRVSGLIIATCAALLWGCGSAPSGTGHDGGGGADPIPTARLVNSDGSPTALGHVYMNLPQNCP
jgi:hypothetical protein